MIKVIIERHIKRGEDLAPLLRELRATAVHQPGYVTGETLASTEDKTIIVVVSTWQSLEHWKRWEASGARTELYQRIEPLLAEKPKARAYEILATEDTRPVQGEHYR